MIKLLPVSDKEQVEWLRVQRSQPELYRYFRQDGPLTLEHQAAWWRNLDKTKVKLFIITTNDRSVAPDRRVGYVGFNPLLQASRRAEFGVFIIPEERGHSYGRQALLELLRRGFTEYNLSTIYSDCLEYPGEDRFKFYGDLGFEKYPEHSQGIRYKKQGKWVPSIKFFMTKDMWESRYAENANDRLGPPCKNSVAVVAAGGIQSERIHTGKNRLNQAAE